MIRKISTILFYFIFPVFSFSQLQVKNFFSITGKKDVPVNAIVQDQTGFLWLGTTEGLYIFDGKKTEEILAQKEILKKEITALYVDSKDVVWIGTKKGLIYYYDRQKLDSLVLPVEESPEKITSFYEINGNIFAATYGNGLYARIDGKILHYTTQNGLSDNVIYKITGDKKNKIWCGTDAGITEFNGIPANIQSRIISNKTGLPDNIVRDLVWDGERLMVSMQDSGICSFNLEKNIIERNSFFRNWSQGTVLNAFQREKGAFFIGTEKDGLIQIDKGRISVYDYQTHILSPSINQLFIDREKQIWIASRKGISHFTERRYHLINSSSGLKDEKVLALAIDNDNGIWVGTTSGVSKVMQDGTGAQVVKEMYNAGKYTISCAAKAPDGSVWFGTYGNGIVALASSASASQVLNSASGHLSNDNVSHIYFENDKVFISTLGGGLIRGRVNQEGGKSKFTTESVLTESEGIGSNYVYASISDGNGNLFIATDGGGLQILRDGKFTDITKKFGFRSSTVFSLTKGRGNVIWATSNADGLFWYDGVLLRSVNKSNGLRDEQPQQIIAGDNALYAVNSKGIDKINALGKISYYDLLEGDFEPNLNAIVFHHEQIYSGTNNGILTFRTNSESSDSIKPVVYLSSFFLNYKPFPIDSIYEFRYNQNSMGFAFDGIWLKNPAKLLFRYKLVGLENEWQYSNEGKTANYTNLGPGNYTFILQVKNDEDVWSEPTGHSFIILTPLWKRWWFWLSALVLISGGIYFFITYRLKALQRENLLLERRVKERTHQIEKQSEIIAQKNKELEQLSIVASKTDNVVLILDANGKLEYINESFQKMNGISIAELKAKYGETIYELSNHPGIREIITEAVTQKKSVNYESLNKKATTGAEIWESSTLTPIFDDEGALRKIIIIDTDVTLRKKQEQIIVQKNKDITDSISYAKKIQHAILPAESLIKNNIPDLFVLYMTKDIVSGDFFWFSHVDNYSIIAAVDCTGHGVPGAFMSLIGYNLLNRIVNEEKITDPKNILMELNMGVLGVLHKNESESKDGMDIAICKINHAENTMQYAGAMRPLWIVREASPGKKELIEVKADKIPIGTKQKDRADEIRFTTHTFALSSKDSYYIFTDGYADQFGGPKDKKYSTGRFKELVLSVAGMPHEEQESRIRTEHNVWKGDHEQVDDILVIGFRLTPDKT